MAPNPQAKIDALRQQIDRHNYLYYVQDAPTIGDDAYDQLLNELRALEAEYPELVTPDSPTQRVGGKPLEQFAHVHHLQPMLSLANAKGEKELRAWDKRITAHLAKQGVTSPVFRYVVEPKIDGLAISLIYRNGCLERGTTRGDGEVGEDVTQNLRTIRSIPLTVPDAPELIEVRGEVYLPVAAFAELNERRLAAGEAPFMNPRNSAAGSIRQLDPQLAAERPLNVWIYGVGVTEGVEFVDHWSALQWLRDRGFRVNSDIQVLESIDDVVAQCKQWEDRRDGLDFEIDGVVVKVSDYYLQRRLGVVGREPRAMIAWKFPPTTAVTTLHNVAWNVGRTGHLVPFAELEPVVVRGVTVKLATLHNEEDLARKDVRPGDKVIVLRAGDVIPQVVSPAPEAVDRADRADPPVPPMHCPTCGTPTVKPETGVWTVCPNRRGCSGQQWQALRHFVHKGAMDIEGIGDKQAQRFMEEGLVRDPADLYALTEEKIAALDGFQEVSARNIVKAIARSKQRPFERVLFGLGISGIGGVNARNLAVAFGSIDAMMDSSQAEIEEVPGIGPVLAAQIVEELRDPATRELISRLKEAGLQLEGKGKGALNDGPLRGKTFVLTGSLPNLTREEATEQITAAGGRVTSSVSKKTDYIVAGADPGTKLAKGQRLGISVVDEGGLRGLLSLP